MIVQKDLVANILTKIVLSLTQWLTTSILKQQIARLSVFLNSSPLVIDNKIDRERGTFEPNIDVRGGIDRREFKGVYNSVVKVNV